MQESGFTIVSAIGARPAMPPKRRGRPPKSVDAAAQAQRVALDEFTAARGFLQGLTPQEACRRYLTREEPPASESVALKRIIQTLHCIARAAAQRRGEAQQSAHAKTAADTLVQRALDAQARRQELLRRAAIERARGRQRELAAAQAAQTGQTSGQGGTPCPTLRIGALPSSDAGVNADALPAHLLSIDAFAEHYLADPDHDDPDWREQEWSEALQEAVDVWRAEHPAATIEPPRPALLAPLGAIAHVHLQEARPATGLAADSALSALEHCRWVIDRKPEQSDLVDAWFTPTTAERLKAADLPTLYALVAWVNRRGKTWWRKVPGLGPVRAARIDQWLQSVGVESGLPLHADLSLPLVQARHLEAQALARRTPQLEQLAANRLEPLALALQSEEFSGRSGRFRSEGNLYGAENDIEALIAALGKYEEKPLTHRLYALEMCRFALWCYRELRKPLSSVTIPDAREYRAFLHKIPSDWINPDPVPRTSAAWRPFRGQLSPGSIRKALTAVHIILGQMHQAGYLAGNPMAGLLKQSDLPTPELDTTRSLSADQWEVILEQLERQPGAGRLAALERLAKSKPKASEALRAFEYAKARRLSALVRLLRATGLRRDECFKARLSHMSVEEVDGQEEYVLRVVGKRNKARNVPLPRAIVQLIRAHLADRPLAGFADDLSSREGLEHIPLISVLAPALPRRAAGALTLEEGEHADPSGALSADGMYRVLKRFLVDCATVAGRRGLDASRFRAASTHWLRHTFGKTMMDRGADPRVVQRMMGHSSLSTTAHYARADDHEMIRAHRAAMPDA